MIRERLNDCECDGIAEQTAQPRLSITVFLHRASLSRFRNSGNVEMNTVMSSPNQARSSPAAMGLFEEGMLAIDEQQRPCSFA